MFRCCLTKPCSKNPQFSWTFYVKIYFCSKCQEGWKPTVEGHLEKAKVRQKKLQS